MGAHLGAYSALVMTPSSTGAVFHSVYDSCRGTKADVSRNADAQMIEHRYFSERIPRQVFEPANLHRLPTTPFSPASACATASDSRLSEIGFVT